MAKVIQVIEVETGRGKGTEDDVMRRVIQYWTLDGELLAEHDPLTNPLPPTGMTAFMNAITARAGHD